MSLWLILWWTKATQKWTLSQLNFLKAIFFLVVFGNCFQKSSKNTGSSLQSPFNFEFIDKVNQVVGQVDRNFRIILFGSLLRYGQNDVLQSICINGNLFFWWITPPLKVDQTSQKGHPIIKHFYWSQKRYQPLQFKYVRFPQREMHVWAAGNGVASTKKT